MQVASDQPIPALLLIGCVFFASLSSILLVLWLRERRKRNPLPLPGQARQELEWELLQSRLEFSEHALRRIAREIHDNLGQMLSVVKLNMHSLLSQLDGEGKELVQETKEIVDLVISDLRQFSQSHKSELMMDQPLQQWLGTELDRLHVPGTLETSLEVDGEEREVETLRKLLFIRMIQEALSNVVRHAEASALRVELHHHPAAVRLRLVDNGMGFNPATVREGNGWVRMKKRAAMIGATLAIDGLPGSGCSVTIEVPYELAPAPAHS
ncbi:MAG: hypothetical protein K1X47_00430 [Cyclobacteriaceae bacterium]|nr:hypothetical protein [Cyclobacteriaceae bacterium]